MPPSPGTQDTGRAVAMAGALAIGGYLAYRYWYLPAKMKEDLQAAMMARGAAPGSNPLAVLGGAACQAYGAKYGLPPQASQGICGELASAAAQVIQGIPNLVGGTLQATGQGLTYIGDGAGNLINAVGTGIGGGVQGVAGGVAGGAVAIGSVPIKIVGNTVVPIYNGMKTVVGDVKSGIGGVANDIKHFVGSIF